MELLKEYAEKYGLKKVINDFGEARTTKENSIVFPNGFVASIVENNGVTSIGPGGKKSVEFKSKKKYSIAMCDYNGYFNWNILDDFGGIEGCIYCDTELEIIIACETIRNLLRAGNQYIVVYRIGDNEFSTIVMADSSQSAVNKVRKREEDAKIVTVGMKMENWG